MTTQHLIGLTPDELQQVARRLGFPTFVGKQIADWLYKKHVEGIDEMSNLSKKVRATLQSEGYAVGARKPVKCQRSKDGTVKYLFPTTDGHFVETVYIPDKERATLCVSCQVGCKMKCAFCMTGRLGFVSSLSAADILNQIYSFENELKIKHPENNFIKDKLRQQLQYLRDKGFIEFLGNGHYRKI